MKKLLPIILIAVFVLAGFVPAEIDKIGAAEIVFAAETGADAENENSTAGSGSFSNNNSAPDTSQIGDVQILFTHDLHSRLDTYDKEGEERGGFARLSSLIANRRYTAESQGSATFVLDAGDFSMGTLYQTIYETEASELIMLGQLGYDATTFGNHEFDYRSEGVANMFNAAVSKAEADPSITLPQFVISNIDWEINNSDDNKLVKNALDNYGAKECIIIEKNGIKAGIFGVVGDDAEACAPESGIDFGEIVEASKIAVEALKAEGADIIICLSHAGTEGTPSKTEDEILAKEVPEIDVIISGHSHTILPEPIVIGDTYIVSAGEYGQNLGEINLTKNDDGRWSLAGYTLNPVDSSIEADPETEALIQNYRDMIDEHYLAQFGYTYDQVLAVNNHEFTPISRFAAEVADDTLGSIIADSFRYAVKEAEGENYVPVDVVFIPSGVIRDTIPQGEVTVWDVFNISSLGIGPDRIAGYPVLTAYLTGAELKTVAEIDVSVSRLMSAAQLYPCGMQWTYNENRMIMNRVVDTKLVVTEDSTAAGSAAPEADGGAAGISMSVPEGVSVKTLVELEDDKLYRIACGLYSAQMLGSVEDLSFGLLSITPKDENGNPIEDFETRIVYDRNGNELKEWYALASYLDSFPENEDGVSEIPDKYAEPDGRKIEVYDKGIGALLSHPSKIAKMLYAAIAVVIAVIAIVVFGIVKLVKRRKKKKAQR